MNSAEVLDYYRQMTPNTEPGELAYLFDNLPVGLVELCHLIKCQLIHPNFVSKYRHQLTNHTKREDLDFYTTSDMLEALLERNANGIIMEREHHERLIVSCRYHALMLMSMLRFQQIPVRCRVGFARYLSETRTKYIDHWICEVWDSVKGRWMFVDPDMELIDLEADDEFLLAGDAWLMARDKEVNPKLFGVQKSWGLFYIRNNLCHDLHAVLGQELRYWELPPICSKDMSTLEMEELELLDEVALYLQDPDVHYDELRSIYRDYPDLRFP